MALEPGGYADKLGNRYEGRWVARQLLLLLCERIASVTLESVGDDEAGVDLWVERLDGTREAQQCKAENGTKSNWSLKDLRSRGVLSHLRTQLERDNGNRFSFVSSTPANHLRDLSRSARDSLGDVGSFYEHQIQSGSQDRRTAFSDFCDLLELSESNAEEREIAFNFLSRSDFHLFSDDREEREDLKWMASQSVTGDANAIIALIADFAADNLRKAILVSDVRRHLQQSGFEPRKLLADERIEPKLAELRSEFEDSIGPHLAGGKAISRPEVNQVEELLLTDDRADAIVLHGAAGLGKSGVLYQLCRRLDEADTPHLALRLDRKIPRGNSLEFGRALGLPDSPVNCLGAIAKGRRCVLVLDQLDALRWTSAHATEGLDVCKSLLREVRTLRRMGAAISVVFCCRTFDLEHDPQLKSWLRPSETFKLEKVAVSELPEHSVTAFVESFDVNFGRMTPRRKSLLRSVRNLAIWAEVVKSEQLSPEFDSGSDLLRAFWKSRRRELQKAGFAPVDTQRILDNLTDYMESNATLSAPKRFVELDEGIATELQTFNIIHVDRRVVSFCHQSYLDFLIASRALERISTSQVSITEWIGDRKEQSLFRREQLRQLLLLLADEEEYVLPASLRAILSSHLMRFHIQQLAIETMGQLRPTDELRRLVLALLDDAEWRDHVFRDVVHGNDAWIDAIHQSGRLVAMLLSFEPSEYGTAAWLLNSIANRASTLVDSVLLAVTNAGATDRLGNFLLFSDAHTESDAVFRFRLSFIATDPEPPYIKWDELAKTRPDRAIKLLAVFLDDWSSDRAKTRIGRRLNIDQGNDLKAIRAAARRRPILTTRLLGPILRKFARRRIKEHRLWNDRAEDDTNVRYPTTKFPKILLSVFRTAVVTLAKRHPNRFIQLNRRLESLRSRSVQALLCRGWSALSADEHADMAIDWLLASHTRFRCGSQRRQPRWHEASRLIKRMSPHCSNETFDRLEKVLSKHRDPDEKRLASWWLKGARDGYYFNGFGAAAFFLLSAIAPERRSAETVGRIGVLNEKFSKYPKDHFLRSGIRGGMVRSPLGNTAIERMSDKQWLRLIRNPEIPSRDGAMDIRKYGKGRVTESSVEMFSRDFGIAAKREPERFGRLALKFPKNVPPEYLAEVIGALEESKPLSEVPEPAREAWQPASQELVEQVINSVNLSNDSYLMRRFCWLLMKRSDLTPSERIVSRLVELTTHGDPDRNANLGETKDERLYHFTHIAINHVRSLAVSAIGSTLYDHEELFDRFAAALEARTNDDHPAVRLAMVDVCLPVWNFNRDLAVHWFVTLARDDLWPACGHNSQRFLNYAFPEFTEQLTPLIRSMVESDEPEIAEEGAEEVFARWLFFGVFGDLVERCRAGTEPQRKGVAKVAAQFARNEKYAEKCLPVLLDFCNDQVAEIRNTTARAFRDERLLSVPNVSSVLTDYLSTEAFDDDPGSLCDALHDFTGPLVQFSDIVFATVSRSIEILNSPTDKQNRRLGLLDRHMSSILLRLYEQSTKASQSQMREKCLDAIDDMLKHRVAPARSLLEEISK